MDTITLVNLILCIAIVVFGCVGFKRAKDKWPLYIAISFGLFGLSHLLTLLGFKETLETFLIGIRTVAYLLVLYTVYQVAFTIARGRGQQQ
jgi:hypothetical protein